MFQIGSIPYRRDAGQRIDAAQIRRYCYGNRKVTRDQLGSGRV